MPRRITAEPGVKLERKHWVCIGESRGGGGSYRGGKLQGKVVRGFRGPINTWTAVIVRGGNIYKLQAEMRVELTARPLHISHRGGRGVILIINTPSARPWASLGPPHTPIPFYGALRSSDNARNGPR